VIRELERIVDPLFGKRGSGWIDRQKKPPPIGEARRLRCFKGSDQPAHAEERAWILEHKRNGGRVIRASARGQKRRAR
jgi:hypothetical protein